LFVAYAAGAVGPGAVTITPSTVAAATGSATIDALVTQSATGAQGATVAFTSSIPVDFSAASCFTDATGHCTVTVSRATLGRATITGTVATANPVATGVAEITFQGPIRQMLANGADHTVTIAVSGGDLTLTIDAD